MPGPQPVRVYRFGVFEADAGTGELRRQGIRIRLHAQPFQVLTMLLERPGEMLTREEISRELWPEGTFVDYEHGVNSAVNRLREALGDKARNPRFIETLARRGYRFVAPVERVGAEPAPAGAAAAAETRPAVSARVEAKPGLLDRVLATPEDMPQSPHHVVQALFLSLQAMYLGFYVGALANLAEINELLSAVPYSTPVYLVLIMTSALLIPLRAFLLCGVLFRAPDMRGKILKLWPALLLLDLLWALAPFLLLHHMPYGLALACTSLLVYAPFAQRSLVLMGAAGQPR